MIADQNHPFGQVVHHRVQGEMQQIAAIHHRNHLHARRQDAVVELVDLFVNRRERWFLFRAFAHHHLP